jgi:hypothetical protein
LQSSGSKSSDPIEFGDSVAHSKTLLESLIKDQTFSKLEDFESHLTDISKDWFNESLLS